MPINLNLLSCPKCGGKLSATSEEKYLCSFCERVWEKEIDDTFDKILFGASAALSEQRAADIARLKRALYEETHKEFISDREVSRICKDILEHHDDEDFYARFYLSASKGKRTAFSDFCEECDIASRKEDVPELLDYLIKGLREEWIANVSEIIEKAFKNSDTALYSKYRTKFEEMAEKVNKGIFEPTLHRDVFVMYSSKDMEKVLKMVSVLENDYGLTCFVAAKNLKHGAGSEDRYKDAIHTAIKNCDVYLLISSNNSRDRQCEVYEEVLYIMDNFPHHPRVQYLSESYNNSGMENKFKEFFDGLEWCLSYKDTADKISKYCDDIKRGLIDIRYGNTAKSSGIDSLLLKAKKLVFLGKYNEAFKEYERLTDEHPEDIRPYIGVVSALSENYTNEDCPEAQSYIKMIDKFFGKNAGAEADEDYADYLTRIKAASLKRSEEAERAKREKEDAEKARKLEEERIKREKEEAARKAAEEAEKAKRLEEERLKREKEEAERKRKEEEEKRNAYTRNGNSISFGSWPQSKVTDSSLISALNSKAGTLPKYGNNGSWISYKYYIEEENTDDFMWYQDIEHNGEKYRGIYFTSYRPYFTTYESNEKNTSQKGNGYNIGTVYWFKWEPLIWRILEEKSGKAMLLSNMLIDSREYYDNDFSYTVNGKTIYPNNYEYSNIRRWLNETFLEGAFTATQKGLISLTTVDNSAQTTNDSSNEYACENTSDSIFLLSYKDAVNEGYGFNDVSSRLKKTTDYAQSQGACTYSGNGWWWLRSPFSNYSNNVSFVYSGGVMYNFIVSNTNVGVCPALWIDLCDEASAMPSLEEAKNYYFGTGGFTKDHDKAFRMSKELAESGNSEAQNLLGSCYYNGQGVTKDYAEAVKWYRKAAEQGQINAQYNLGICYYNGRGVTKDYAEAVKWYRKAAEQGDANAQSNLGDCYYNGHSVTQDYFEAVKWFKKAAERNYSLAQCWLGICYYNGQGVKQDYSEAVKWYRKAADQGYALAQCWLAYCYETGCGTVKNISEAVKYYRLAAKQGSETAIKNLKELGYSI